MFPLLPWVKGDKSIASLTFPVSWVSSVLCWTAPLSQLAWALWQCRGKGTAEALEGTGAGRCRPTELVSVLFPLMKNSLLGFFSLSVVTTKSHKSSTFSFGRSVSALGYKLSPCSVNHTSLHNSNAVTVLWKCFPLTCEINLFIGRYQNKPLWSGNIIVPFRFYFDEAYNTIPVNHLFKS